MGGSILITFFHLYFLKLHSYNYTLSPLIKRRNRGVIFLFIHSLHSLPRYFWGKSSARAPGPTNERKKARNERNLSGQLSRIRSNSLHFFDRNERILSVQFSKIRSKPLKFFDRNDRILSGKNAKNERNLSGMKNARNERNLSGKKCNK